MMNLMVDHSHQVTIIIYLSVVGSLLLYMLFLLLVDPLIRRHNSYTQPLHNEEDSEVLSMVTLFLSLLLSLSLSLCSPLSLSASLFLCVSL